MTNYELNLQLFATGENLNTTTELSAEMKTFYDKTLITLASPYLVHDQFGQKRDIPKNGGKIIEFRKFSSLPKALTPLTEGVTPSASAVYSCYLDGLELTGDIVYKVGVKAIQETTSGEIKEEIVYVYQPNGQFNGGSRAIDEFENATEYRFTYGLPNAPVLSEQKSSSVRLTWSALCNHGTPELYSIFDSNSNVVIATTTETTYLVTNLLAGQTYDFFIRAYKEGNYTVTYSVTDNLGGKATKTITVTVKRNIVLAESITINGKINNLYVGSSKLLSAIIDEKARDNYKIENGKTPFTPLSYDKEKMDKILSKIK